MARNDSFWPHQPTGKGEAANAQGISPGKKDLTSLACKLGHRVCGKTMQFGPVWSGMAVRQAFALVAGEKANYFFWP